AIFYQQLLPSESPTIRKLHGHSAESYGTAPSPGLFNWDKPRVIPDSRDTWPAENLLRVQTREARVDSGDMGLSEKRASMQIQCCHFARATQTQFLVAPRGPECKKSGNTCGARAQMILGSHKP